MTYQVTAPLLDACVLGILEKEDYYGYTLTQKVQEVIDISESTLYPVLRRLQKEGELATYDSPVQGRNRRYYRITPEGKEKLKFYKIHHNKKISFICNKQKKNLRITNKN